MQDLLKLLLGFLLLLLLPAGLVPAQTLEQKLDTLREFRRFFPRFRETSDRVEAVYTLRMSDIPETAMELLRIMQDRDPEVREAARDVLAGFREAASFDALLEELGNSSDQGRRADIVDVVGRAGYRKAAPAMAEILGERNLPPVLRFHLVRTLGLLDAREEAERLVPFLEDREYIVRLAACDALARFRAKEVGPAVVPLLKDSVWQVRAAAIAAAGAIRVEEAVEPLIEILGEPGRLQEDASRALFRITGYNFGLDHEFWKEQWARLKQAGFRIPTDEELAKAEEAQRAADARYKPAEGSRTFAGIETTSTNIVFVIDVSGSMADLVVERERFRQAGYESFERMEIVKEELINTIKGLDQTTNFNIISFATNVHRWKNSLVPGTITNKASSISWASRLRPLGGREDAVGGDVHEGKTNTYGALMAAFELDPARDVVVAGGAPPRNRLDTIFFLSDGRPTTGRFVDTSEIRSEIRRINETRRVVIHTIAIGEFQKDFMRQLAQENHGIFVDLGG